MARILVVDDDVEIRDIVTELLQKQGHEVVLAEDGEAGLRALRAERPGLVLLDLGMPRLGGMDALSRLRSEGIDVPVVVLTASDDVPLVVDAMRLGAYDFMTKPFRIEDLVVRVRQALEHEQLVREVQSLTAEFGAGSLWAQMGSSAAVEKLIEQVRLVAGSNYTVLIVGETGTGKELVARAIHNHSPRRGGRFVALDCGAIPGTLIESELFGHEKGAFTGAERRKDGHFHLADAGTLFLDELANLPLAVQGALLRALQEREIRRIGAKDPTPIDVRVVGASNVPLAGEIQAGRFRADLYYRLNEFSITLPPLRERSEDVPHLAHRFLEEASRELKRPPYELEDDALALLRAHTWPGNVRELRNAVRRAALLSSGVISREHLDVVQTPVQRSTGPGVAAGAARRGRTLREFTDHAEQEAIRQALEETRGNKSEAARLLGVDYKTLYLKLKRYAMSAGAPVE